MDDVVRSFSFGFRFWFRWPGLTDWEAEGERRHTADFVLIWSKKKKNVFFFFVFALGPFSGLAADATLLSSHLFGNYTEGYRIVEIPT